MKNVHRPNDTDGSVSLSHKSCQAPMLALVLEKKIRKKEAQQQQKEEEEVEEEEKDKGAITVPMYVFGCSSEWLSRFLKIPTFHCLLEQRATCSTDRRTGDIIDKYIDWLVNGVEKRSCYKRKTKHRNTLSK